MTEKITYPKITIVTPNYNQGDFIERTIRSVLDQNYPNLEYIIIDGGSSDNSTAIIKKYEDQLTQWVSEPDEGMYYAINKGFSGSTGEIMCWINSDDVLWENSLFTVAEIFSQNKKVEWLQGYPSVIDEQGQLLYQRDPVASKYYFYSGAYKHNFSFIQQESTFWTRTLWEKAGGTLNTDYLLAADFDLWMRFFQHDVLYCTRKQLAAFRKRKGQKSEDGIKYLQDADKALIDNLKALNLFGKTKLGLSKIFGNSMLKEPIKWIAI